MSSFLLAEICDLVARGGPVTPAHVAAALDGYAKGRRAARDMDGAGQAFALAAEIRDGRRALPAPRPPLAEIARAKRLAFAGVAPAEKTGDPS